MVVIGVAVLAVTALVVALWPGGSSFEAPSSVDALARRIDATVPDALREFHVPGAQVAVVEGGAVRWSGAYGDAGPDTRFQIASVSKVVAAYSTVRLAEAGRVDLDAPVAGRPAGVTLRRLLSHTAGTDVPGYLGVPEDRPLPSLAEAAARVRVVREPGSAWAYSGGGYTVAQLELERLLRRPYADLVRDTTFRPLGMTHSDFACTTAKTLDGAAARGGATSRARPAATHDDATSPAPTADARGGATSRARPAATHDDATSPAPTADVARGHDRDGRPLPRFRYAELAAAGVCSTAADLGRLLAAVLREPAMARPQPATDGGFGLGLHLERLGDGTRMLWHDGANRGWQSHVAAFPERGWGIAVVTDGDAGGRVIERVLGLLVKRSA